LDNKRISGPTKFQVVRQGWSEPLEYKGKTFQLMYIKDFLSQSDDAPGKAALMEFFADLFLY